MKNGNKCSKCSSSKIFRVPGNDAAYGIGSNMIVGWTHIKVTRYVCAQCGYIEYWIDSKEDLLKAEEEYSKD